jgi:putative transposase
MKNEAKKQLEFNRNKGWGGKRARSGRPNLSGTVSHMKRSLVNIKTPLHITLRLEDRLPSIRNKRLLIEFKKSAQLAKAQGLYILQFSIQSNHIHIFAESKGNRALALGMQSLAGRFARIIRSYSFKRGGKSKGSVFQGRYHLHVLKTPSEVKNTLEYVLLNLSKHQKLIEYIDSFSSGRFFRHWPKLLGARYKNLIRADVEFFEHQENRSDSFSFLSQPQSWLAQTGWMRACG